MDININDELINVNAFPLPDEIHTPASFQWGESSGDDCIRSINDAYEEIVTWRRNVFLLPSGKAGKAFIKELTRLYQAYMQMSHCVFSDAKSPIAKASC